ncbi:thiolase family protein [Halopelagius longus]|uniref:Acetyl-CoA acetyltransferase n=1 Tax=Halopelagius longus TaxID=1236180 RepID=A0A1H1FL51_9EURY|nr:thiolase family protein [Halopelagius longus]RDI70053.1 thiolase family protein [Halopelagius longus]SDR01548.1 acetyl-CoA acetyltransferase [Halopelagius longus]
MTRVVVIDGCRTPHGALLGALSDTSAVELGARTLRGLLDRTDVDPAAVDWAGLGNAIQAGVGQAPARQAVTEAGLPNDVAATTINEASGSGLRALTLAFDRIQAGRASVAVAGGMESMSNAPYLSTETRKGRRYGDVRMRDAMIYDGLWDVGYAEHMGALTERLVEEADISREAQDEYALESHRRAVEAIEAGRFEDEIVPVETDSGTVEVDEGPREDTDMDRLGSLSPAFESDGTITAGNASDLSDGAGALLLASADAVDDSEALATVADYAVSYRDPMWFGKSVSDAVTSLLDANDLTVEDIGFFELNEAFAAQMVYTMDRLDVPREKLNPLGGAIAYGHPIGGSGGLLATTLAHAMAEDGVEYGVVGMSVGGGGGIAVLLRR